MTCSNALATGRRFDQGFVKWSILRIFRYECQSHVSQICKIMHHSPEAVANYLSTFARCAASLKISTPGLPISKASGTWAG